MSPGRVLSVLLGGIMCFNAVGCSASGPAFEPMALTHNEAAVYVYRPGHDYQGSLVVLPIKVDGKTVGGLVNNGYVYQTLTPGPHVVSCSTEQKSTVPFVAEPGRSYYITAEVQWGVFVGRPNLTMVPEETGKLAILGTKLCRRE